MSYVEDAYEKMDLRSQLLKSVKRTIDYMGVIIKEGDIVEVTVNLREPPEMLTFVGWHPYLFEWCFIDKDGNYVIIPQKQIKRLKVFIDQAALKSALAERKSSPTSSASSEASPQEKEETEGC